MSVVTKRSAIILKKEDVEKEIKEEVTMGSKLYIYMAGVFISMLQLSKIATKSIKVMVLSNVCLLPYSYFHLDQIPKNRSHR